MPRSLVLAAAAAAALVAGTFPTVMFGDDGELVRAVFGIGQAHPPGFPAYLLLAKPLTLLPFGTVAFRVHLASVLASVLAALLAHRLALRWGSGTHGAWIAAVAFLAAPIAWQQSRLARTYPFLAAVTLAVVLLADRIDRGEGTRRSPAALLFLCGLGGAVHQLTVVPLAAALLLLVVRRPRGAFAALPFLPLGACAFLLLPLRSVSAAGAPGWGTAASFRDLLAHLLQSEYAGKVVSGGGSFLALAGTIAASLPREMTVPLLALAVIGLAALARRRPTAAALLAGIALGTMLLRAAYAGAGETGPDSYRVIVRYLLGPLALVAVAAGVGWGTLLRAVGTGASGMPAGVATALTVVGAAALALRPVAAGRAETPWLWHDQARGTLLSAPPRGIVLVGGDDILFPIWYLQGLGGYAPDRVATGIHGFGRPWYRGEVAAEAAGTLDLAADAVRAADSPDGLVAVAAAGGAAVGAAMIPPGAPAAQRPELVGERGRWSVHGLVYRLAAPPAAPGDGALPWRAIPVRGPVLAAPPESRVPLSQVVWFLTVAARDSLAAGRPAEALPLLFRASALDPGDAVIHNEIGRALMGLNLRGRAAEAFREALRLRPGDPDIAGNLAVAESSRDGQGARTKEPQ